MDISSNAFSPIDRVYGVLKAGATLGSPCGTPCGETVFELLEGTSDPEFSIGRSIIIGEVKALKNKPYVAADYNTEYLKELINIFIPSWV